jgi:aconitate hydratase
VIAESFERIHRSNLVGMGVLPLEFPAGVTRKTLGLDGSEDVAISGIPSVSPRAALPCTFRRPDGREQTVELLCRLDTPHEADYYRHGGLLHYVLRQRLARTHRSAA